MTLKEFLEEWNNSSETILVHTSGSTGKPKPMLVEKRRMEASARITCRFLGLKSGDTALLCDNDRLSLVEDYREDLMLLLGLS